MTALVRPYQPADRAAILAISADTAYFGDPVEAYLEDRRLAQDFFVSYYLDHEPEHAWTAEADGVVVGYLTGSVGGASASQLKTKTVLRAGVRLATFQYRLGPLSRRYALRAARAALLGEFPNVDLKQYPAELHINLSAAARGLGLGKKLLYACLDQMTALGMPGIHLNTTSRNGAALRLYEKAGFELLGRHVSTLWEPWLPGEAVENLVYGKLLCAGEAPSGVPAAKDSTEEAGALPVSTGPDKQGRP